MNLVNPAIQPTYFVCGHDGTHLVASPQPSLVPSDIFDTVIVLIEGDCGPEPSIRDMIEYYYRQAFTPEQAAYHANELISKALGTKEAA